MGAFQSKVWSEVASSASPGSPSESEPVSNNKKPAAPFRDPRSVSDGVDRTPIQFSEDRQGKVPSANQTPTGPSLAGRFKDLSTLISKMDVGLASDDKLTVNKEEEPEADGQETEDNNCGLVLASRSTEITDLSDAELRRRLEAHSYTAPPITDTTRRLLLNKLVQLEGDGQKTTKSKSTFESDCRSPLLIEGNDSAIEMNTARCGKKTMFPMTFGFQEAKSPRSPLGNINLNAKFKASPASLNNAKGAGDFKIGKLEVSQNKQEFKPQRLSMENEMGDLLHDQENDAAGQNSSLVI